jgi:ankyrin repeat protein
LINRGIDINQAFLIASVEGNVDVLKMLIKKGIKDIIDQNGFEAACENGHVNVLKFLLTKGFTVYNIGINQSSYISIYLNLCICMYKSNISLPGEWSETFGYHVACEYGHVGVVKYLIEEGFRVNTRDNDGLTCFHYALKSKDCKSIVKLILEKGFDINYAFKIACQEENVGIINTIIDYHNFNFHLTSIEFDGLTAFQVACLHGGNVEIIKILLNKGANMNQLSQTGDTGFTLACFEGYLETCLYLIKLGVSVDADTIQNYGINSVPCYCVNCLHKQRRSGSEIEKDMIIVLGAYIREKNWRRRNNFAMLFKRIKFS